MSIIRTAIEAFAGPSSPANNHVFAINDKADQAIDYYDGINDRDMIRAKMIELYGIAIKLEQDPARAAAGLAPLETYVKQGFGTLVDGGGVEVVSIGYANKVISARATLFTEQGQKYTLSNETTEDTEAAEELLNYHRTEGGHQACMVRADRVATGVRCSAILLSYANQAVTYDVLSPNSVRIFHEESVTEKIGDGDVERTRPSNPGDIEDATLVICRLDKTGPNQWNYLAIYSRSDDYPYGRWVEYTNGDNTDVPAQNTDQVNYEYEIDGVFCNPLSYIAAHNPDALVPEFPIVVIKGPFATRDSIISVSTSLCDACLEFSCAASHTLSKSQQAASGTKVFTDTNHAAGKPLPRTSTGIVHCTDGRTFDNVAHDSASILASYEILKKLMIDAAGSYGVPDYMVVAEDHAIEASSGIALQVKTRPLKKARETSIEDNRPAVGKIFDIERALIYQYSEDPAKELLFGCEQTWDAGELKMPENKKEMAERVALAKEKGLTDEIGALLEYHQLPSDEEAIKLYETMAERANDYPPLVKPLNEQQAPAKKGLLRKPKEQPAR